MLRNSFSSKVLAETLDDKESDDHGSAEKLTGDKSCTDSSFDSRDEGSANLINPKRSSEISRQEPSDTNAPALDEKPNLLSHSLTGSSHAEEKHHIEEIDIIDFNDSILTGQDKNDSISSRSRGERTGQTIKTMRVVIMAVAIPERTLIIATMIARVALTIDEPMIKVFLPMICDPVLTILKQEV